MKAITGKSQRALELEKSRGQRVVSKRNDMNSKPQANVFVSHGTFKHTAKPATLESVLQAFGLKKSDLRETKELVLADRNKSQLAHAR